MNVLFHEARRLARSAWIWALVLCAVAALYMSLFSEVAKDVSTFKAIFSAYPAAIQHALGVTLDGVASLPGFYTMVLTMVTLLGAIQASNAGVSILSKEAREGTADFLYTKPISRAALVTAKLGAAVLVLVATDVVYWLVSGALLAGLSTSGGPAPDSPVFALMDGTLLAVQLMLFSLGLAVSLAFRRLRNVLPVSLGLVFGLYLIGVLLATEEGKRWLSPFQFFNLHDVIANQGYDTASLVATALVIVVGIALAYIVTVRRDLHVR